MKWGRISENFTGFGWKRLSGHEIDPSISNGHEFQGVKALEVLLGSEERKKVPTQYYLIHDDSEGAPAVEETVRAWASWYDSRRKDPTRSAEWRLYYPTEAGVIQKAKPGDLMILGQRRDSELSVFLVSAGSAAETALINLLRIDAGDSWEPSGIKVFDAPNEDIGLSGHEAVEQLTLSMEALGTDLPPPLDAQPNLEDDQTVEIVGQKMIDQWPVALGSCADVVQLISNACSFDPRQIIDDPDGTLMYWLEVAEASYRIWEQHVFSSFLSPIRYDKAISDEQLVSEVSEKWMALRQGRVSRAGRMMEIFLCKVFDAADLRYETGARIEGGKLPDFIFPSAAAYKDLDYDANRLRILGAKTSFKDRWRQILSEGDRVRVKHGVTRDGSITSSIFAQMKDKHFIVVMPESVRRTYTRQPENLISLGQFIQEVSGL